MPNFADGEVPAGVIDGVNRVFTLAHPPNPALSLKDYLNGLVQKPGTPPGDFVLVGLTITYNVAPLAGTKPDTHITFYRY